jgi:general secretion pathway protein A
VPARRASRYNEIVLDEISAGVEEGYERFFALAEPPFRLTSNPRFLFESSSYRSAFNEIDYALLRREPIIVITGSIGTGKTTLCRMIGERRRARSVVAIISSPPRNIDDAFRQILDGFGLITEDTRRIVETSHFGLLKVFQRFLDSLVPLKAQAIVVFDEAQHLRPEILEEIRLLSNLDSDHQTLQIVLVGQPELDALLASPELRQLAQRLSHRHRLEPLQLAEVPAYVDRRLTVAQLERRKDDRPTFTESAMKALAAASHGVPRLVNLICDRSLENAWSAHTRAIDRDAIVRAAASLDLDVPPAPVIPRPVETAPKFTFEKASATAFEPSPRPPVVPVTEVMLKASESGTEPMPEWREAEKALTPPVELPQQPIELLEPAVAAPLIRATPRSERAWPPMRAANLSMRRVRVKRSHAQVAVGAVVMVPLLLVWLLRGGTRGPQGATLVRRTDVSGVAGGLVPAEKPPALAPSTPSPTTTESSTPAPPASTPSPPHDAAASVSSTLAASEKSAASKFLIIVSTFKTRDRATEVAGEVSVLDLPAFVRTASGWEQVVVGPYSSRTDAARAQARLVDSQFTDTKLVQTGAAPTAPPRTSATPLPAPATAAAAEAAAPVTPLARASLSDLNNRPLDDLLRRATTFATQGNVKAVQEIRDQIVKRQAADSPNSAEAFTAALDQLERNLDEARRRQLENDRRLLLTKP